MFTAINKFSHVRSIEIIEMKSFVKVNVEKMKVLFPNTDLIKCLFDIRGTALNLSKFNVLRHL